jgi:hypothetical protein
METNTNVSLQSIYHLNKYQRNLIVNQIYTGVSKIALGTRETVLEGKCKTLAIVKSADNSLMSQKFEIILTTNYSMTNKYQRL